MPSRSAKERLQAMLAKRVSIKGDDKDLLEEPHPSPMDNTPLKDSPLLDKVEDPEFVPEHTKDDAEAPDGTFGFGGEPMTAANPTIPGLPPEEMIGKTFLLPPAQDGSRVRAKIIRRIQETKDQMERDLEDDEDYAKFVCLVNNDREEVVAYNQIVDYIEADQTWDGIWKYKDIIAHKEVKPGDRDYKGCRWNVLIHWETGEKTWEPLRHTNDEGVPDGVYDLDRVTVAIYARKNGLLDTPGWKLPGLKKMAKTQQRILRLANQAKLRSYRTTMKYMYGILVPNNYQQAMELDRKNGNTKWADATKLELDQIDEYSTLQDKGTDWSPPKDYKKIRVHFVYAVKHDGRHKARLVADGHLTATPVESVYSSVVSLRGIRILTFIAEHNGLDLWATDVGNAYLESYTKEKVYIRAGPEFGDREGHYLVIVKALYGLKSSGLRWHERFADVLRDMGFFPSKAENDIWMRDKGDHYEYIAVYVDDLLIASKNPSDIIKDLEQKYQFKLKGTGTISFHLGCDFARDQHGHLYYYPKKYIEKCMDNYKRLFGTLPRLAKSPLTKGDHPELDTSPLLDADQCVIYQSLIGSLQWAIQIGRFDVATATMTLSRFRAAPREGHLDRVKRIYGYLRKWKWGGIKVRTSEPDYSELEKKDYDWFYSCYSGAKEEIPSDIPRPLGLRIIITSFVDANLYHDMISGKSVTGILHFFNKTPIDWYSKLQSTVETATFGSEYIAARICTEQITDLRTTLRYLGVPVEGPSYMFGDNETVVNTASEPHGKLHKRHNALSFHRTRFAIAAGIVRFHHVRGTHNPADVLTKHWDYSSVKEVLKPMLYWHDDTAELVKAEDEMLATVASTPVGMDSKRASQERKSAAVLHGITSDSPVTPPKEDSAGSP